ncbi:NADH:ubiquinone oxidoreductase subunit 11 or 4L (chain K) (NuoK) (PDB:4HE8) [Commensalibacter communis]|uniref:NADH-quinone oxidoreductase subunit K n=1 Tax=Commensalibacter communis TaxID=2972786 RepID=A0A9W4TMN2_9PROT|nr:NADH-quinone oxidoreductase subunit NuoK [Commensalibacter communis]CAI3925200.1 NADH:ubiquinone oxidoreductase subunit 11 or 4L (chain K) (NuoK) (PDB:4HE8) [Commensalibacter communis]CAI3929161.1 NADH:ubiquinone oxidoreductase subunit 11 or 4L (chain K) (NuoK) (PDB:4HE8) [Commensalibacter communis]CAI3929753.1 NADH:ubiquinone oxidoreductase subunit 11 or 4L (chain K) (NuoK) (PDB:4HE8) [Commensalibacter communis]CAI3931719.1 NADH:ubiquinone oxidoreductase subunit 11 or 4L (chain K) (NuoK) (P
MNILNTVGLAPYLIVSGLLFTIGLFGIFASRKNLIVILMSIELMLLSANLNLIAFSSALENLTGQVLVMFTLTVAAAESAIGLAIVMVYYRNRHSVEVQDATMMKG